MKFQLSLSNVLMLIAAVAICVSLWLQLQRNAWCERRLPELINLARELNVDNVSLLHAVESHAEWFGEKKWEVHVPDEGHFTLCLATSNIPDHLRDVEFPGVESSVRLPPGRNSIELLVKNVKTDSGVNSAEVLVNGESKLLVERDKDWYPKDYSTSSSSDVHECESFQVGEKVRLINSRFREMGKQQSPGSRLNGVLLWIGSDSVLTDSEP